MDPESVHAMIDLETLGQGPGAAILSAGIVLFRPSEMIVSPASARTFKVRVDLYSCLDAGLKIDPATVSWWMLQSDAARHDAFGPGEDRVNLRTACEMIAEFLKTDTPDADSYDGPIWCHGASFDIPVLSFAMRLVQVNEPWNFRKVRDTRTVFDLCDVEYSGTHHEPVADALEQALVVSRCIVSLSHLASGMKK